jgi:hypothetical protein
MNDPFDSQRILKLEFEIGILKLEFVRINAILFQTLKGKKKSEYIL